MIIQPNFAGYFGTLGLVPFKVKSFDGKVLAFHIVIIQTNGNSLLYLTLFNPRLPLLWHLDFEELCWLIGDLIGFTNDM